MRWSFTVHGIPVAQGRPRAVRVGQSVRLYDPEKSASWKNLVALASLPFKPSSPTTAALRMEVVVRLPRPKSLPKRIYYPAKRPDLSNYIKGVEDAISGIFFVDDAQIVELCAQKEYSDDPGVYVALTTLDD